MNRHMTFATIILAIAGLSAFAVAEPQNPVGRHSDYVTQLIIKFKEDTEISKVSDVAKNAPVLAQEFIQQMAAVTGRNLKFKRKISTGAHVLKLDFPARVNNAKQLAALMKRVNQDILYIEPDYILYPSMEPNDPRYLSDQWHFKGSDLHGLNLPAAWDITTGSPSTVVAVVDTGILPHEDLDPSRILPGYDFLGADDPFAEPLTFLNANDGDGRDVDATDPGDWITTTESATPGRLEDCRVGRSSWHGTHVTGIIAATSNNSIGTAGIDWQAKILPVRVLGKCGGPMSDIVDGIAWAAGLSVEGVPANPTPAKVINLSLGGPGACGNTFQEAINSATKAGSIVVAAAGNSGDDVNQYQPASCNNVITVGAHDVDSTLTSYSNRGGAVDILAPGGRTTPVYSLWNSGSRTPVADYYIGMVGTSLAAPHVSGLISLMLSLKPDLEHSEVEALLKNNARSFAAFGQCETNPGLCGAGIADAESVINVLNALPKAPEDFAVSVNESSIFLGWTNISTGEYETQIERSTDEVNYTQIAVVAAGVDNYQDDDVSPGTTYHYRLFAINEFGESSGAENFIEVPRMESDKPIELVVEGHSNRQITISWLYQADSAAGFNVYRSSEGDQEFELLAIMEPGSNMLVDLSVKPGATFSYRVTAVLDGAESEPSNIVTAVAKPPSNAGSSGALIVLVLMAGLAYGFRRKLFKLEK